MLQRIIIVFCLFVSILWGNSSGSATAWAGEPLPFARIEARARVLGSGEFRFLSSVQFPASAQFRLRDLDSDKTLSLRFLSYQGSETRLLVENPAVRLREWVKKAAVLEVVGDSGEVLDQTYLQLGDWLDTLYPYEGPLGMRESRGGFDFTIWAPTAQEVSLVFYDSPTQANLRPSHTIPLSPGDSGEWSATVPTGLQGKYYLIKLKVFMPQSGMMQENYVTDPYSYALSANSQKSLLVNWRELLSQFPKVSTIKRSFLAKAPVMYELHVREFSSHDPSVPLNLRGKYKAFSLPDSLGVRHLKDLAGSGVTHVHLLPIQDFSSVEEEESRRLSPYLPHPTSPDSPIPQEAVRKVSNYDAFNWGYDPFHFFAPEGSYATDPDGVARVLEFRELVASLHQIGLGVVMDVAFNHTYSSGEAPESVLDRIVPGYYYRLDARGYVRNTSCCSDTASERKMMGRLMKDATKFWLEAYQIDGFRFDLMNLHDVNTMEEIRKDLKKLRPDVILYGEAWPFGSLLDTQPSLAFTQENAYGRGIAVFNDKIRDALRGGTTDSHKKSDQGFATGLFYDFNHEPANRDTPLDYSIQRDRLLWYSDVISVGLAGNLRDFVFTDHFGNRIRGGDLKFHGASVGVAATPQETINYVSAHDGYSLWDTLAAKLPFFTPGRGTASIPERMDRQLLLLSFPIFSQGIPFIDAGSEILRSKSGDQNSYDSGDWFNRLDWSFEHNNWGVGLPPLSTNPDDWGFWRPRLAESSLKVRDGQIKEFRDRVLNLLKIRASTHLFSLDSVEEVQRRVRFLNGEKGSRQVAGLIVMQILDKAPLRNLDESRSGILVAWNVLNEPAIFQSNELKGSQWRSHTLSPSSAKLEPNDGTILLPPRSVSVFELPR